MLKTHHFKIQDFISEPADTSNTFFFIKGSMPIDIFPSQKDSLKMNQRKIDEWNYLVCKIIEKVYSRGAKKTDSCCCFGNCP
jgi:hypothetical protein